jgi:hypothetical protein
VENCVVGVTAECLFNGGQTDTPRHKSVRLTGGIGRYFEIKQTQSGNALATF